MNDNLKEKLKFNIAISQMINEEKNMKSKRKFIFKNLGIVATVIICLSGAAFAGNKVIEKVWKTPEKIQQSYEITEETRKQNISQDEAKKIAIEKLESIGFNSNIINENEYKDYDSNRIIYRFYTEDDFLIAIDGINGEFYDIWYEKEYSHDKLISEDDAIKKANDFCQLFGYNVDEYEITRIWCNSNNGTQRGDGYDIDIVYNKKYGDVLNPFEGIDVRIITNNNGLGMFRVWNSSFDNNEIKLTKEEAIGIAKQEDKKIETNNIESVKAKLMIVKMNADAYDRINNKEDYYKSRQGVDYPNEDLNFYNVEDKVRNAWVVVITYEDNYGEDVVKRYTEGQYSYFVDATTGEIIGGDTMDYTAYN